ncbi:exostosin family protein [Bizionia sediminis]|uniref:Exostosin family protein n=1 Tax=Bizionia sediminis TaxID=1737064 RepID=A0ABW5KNM7_9FLAO
MKLYYPKQHYDASQRGQVFPLLKAFIKGADFTDAQRQAMYSVSETDYNFVDNLADAEVVVLPMSWNYYVNENKQHLALELITSGAKLNKQVWLVLLGDVGLPIPVLQNTIVFRTSGYRRNLPAWHQGMPVFISDPLKAIYNTDALEARDYSERPRVGFCGLASPNKWDALKTRCKIALKNLGYVSKLYKPIPEAILAAPYFRYQCLKPLIADDRIADNFILRNKYRAGAETKATREQTTAEFYKNIKDSDYVLCTRGAGNFSVRLYETLAMGRIPVYVHTDGLLPLSDKIDWKKHVVWVEKKEISDIAEKVLDFHKTLNQEKMQTLCISNRFLWKDYFRIGAFFNKYSKDVSI